MKGIRFFAVWLGLLVALLSVSPSAAGSRAVHSGYALRFYGHGVNDLDRVKIAINPHRPVDVGAGDFTIEFWLKASLADNPAAASCGQNDGWITANILFDRDVYGSGDWGDYGIALSNGRIAFGVNNGSTGTTLCGATLVADAAWHHIAVTRSSSSGQLRLYVDGVLDGQANGPTGDLSYRDNRFTGYPNSDPFLVLGAEKHDADASQYPSYRGLLDEVRISAILRYTANFTPPSAPFAADAQTAALYHFDEGPAGLCSANQIILDSSGAAGGPSPGVCKPGGAAPAGPVFVTDTPFAGPSTAAYLPLVVK